MEDSRIIYFNEQEHKYTDDLGNAYTSCTTLISKYYEKFNEDEIARHCEQAGRNGNPKYAGKTAKQLIKEWEYKRLTACARGNARHDFLENTIKSSNGYKKVASTTFINDRIYTIEDILSNHEFGRVNLDFFIKTGIKERYPQIFLLIRYYIENGYRAYTEIGAFNTRCRISGLIDLLLVKDNTFVIIDWKTNEADIRYEAGYFKKDDFGNLTPDFVYTEERFKEPLQHLEASVGNKYTLQLSLYDYLIEGFGLTCTSNTLCHIRHENYTEDDGIVNTLPELIGKEKVEFLAIKYRKDDIQQLFDHHYNKVINKHQTKLAI